MRLDILAFFCLFTGCSAAFAGTTATLRHTFDDPTATGRDEFGSSVAIDGKYVLIAAPIGDVNGQVYQFDSDTGSLLKTFDDPVATESNSFGNAIAIDGKNVLIASPRGDTNGQVYQFDSDTGSLLNTFDDPVATESNSFGNAIAIDGDHVLVAAAWDDTNGDNVGQAYLFDTKTGNLLHTLNDPTVTVSDRFGWSVALNGNYALIGAPLDDTNGPGVGQAHLFDTDTGMLLHTFDDPNVTENDFFGRSVALDGNHVLIGADGDDTLGNNVGQAYLFDLNTSNLLHTFDNPTPADFDLFGSSVAIDGNHVLVGERFDDTLGSEVGQAHLFDATTGNLLHTFNDPTATVGDAFGWSVALNGNRILVGAYRDDTNGINVGQAHLFEIVPEPASICLLVAAFFALVNLSDLQRRP